jgi:hypothetical protein
MILEPYITKNQPDITKLWKILKEPVHSDVRRNTDRQPQANALDLAKGFELRLENWSNDEELEVLCNDFENFMIQAMKVFPRSGGTVIEAVRKEIKEDGYEKCRIITTTGKCVIEAENLAGLRRALFNLEEDMTERGYPEISLGESYDFAFQKIRMSRSPLASYRFGSGWELNRHENFYPDEYLNALAHCRINAIWVAGLFREMLKSQTLPELTRDADERALVKLSELTRRASRYGIKVFLFCMEPRALPIQHSLWSTYPELLGTTSGGDKKSEVGTLCFEHHLVQSYMRESLTRLWEFVPELGGLIQIFAGERATSCRSIDSYIGTGGRICERCSEMSQGEALSRAINFQAQVIREIAPKSEYLIWSYGLPLESMITKQYIYEHIDSHVIWLENFEHNVTREFFGRDIVNDEYSLTVTGPSRTFTEMQTLQRPEHPRIWPKFQIGTTYEFSIVPFMPVPSMVNFKQLKAIDCSGAVISWIIGGWPDMMLKSFGVSTSGKRLSEDEFLLKLARLYYSREYAVSVVAVWKKFADILKGYPCDNNVFYYGPLGRCPGYKLYLTGNIELPLHTYNWGLDRNRNMQPCFTGEDSRWTGQFSSVELIEIFNSLAKSWRQACKKLMGIPVTSFQTQRHAAVAETLGIMMQSAANIYEFYLLRNKYEDSKIARRLLKIVAAEKKLARRMLELLKLDPRIGFHSEIYYYVLSPEILNDKIANCESIISTLDIIANDINYNEAEVLCRL